MKHFFMIAGLLLVGCSQGSSFDGVGMAKQVVSGSLKDPGSARWGNIRVEPLHDGYIACGTVNAKNSFGGYSGDSEFRAGFTPSGQGAADIADSPGYSMMLEAQCQILFEVAGRHSPKSRWVSEKAEMMERIQASATALADKAARLNRAGE